MDPLAARAAQYALATLETNGRMGVIVATPTAGSAGVLPGVLLALRDERGFTHDELREGILTAALPTSAWQPPSAPDTLALRAMR